MTTAEATRVEDVKDSILAKIASALDSAESAEHFANIGQLAAAYRQLADASA